MSEPAYDRRTFMAYFGSIGLGSTLLPGVLWGQQQQTQAPDITKEMIASAEEISGLHFSDDERTAMVRDLQQMRGGEPPRLMLNDHCQVCEFRQRCHCQALKEDNLSLLRAVGEKEVKAFARKGIFTITQLSHTFRPRRKGKRCARRSNKRFRRSLDHPEVRSSSSGTRRRTPIRAAEHASVPRRKRWTC